MSKASKVKVEVSDTNDLLELIQVLKDVADIRYHSLVADRDVFERFSESLNSFFQLVKYSSVKHPLVTNDDTKTLFIVLTTEEGFVGDLNSKIGYLIAERFHENPNNEAVCIGRRGLGKLEEAKIKPIKIFEDIAETGLYETALLVKEFVVDLLVEGKFGRVEAIAPFAKDFNTIKVNAVPLLPCDSVLKEKSQSVEQFDRVIEESDPVDMIAYLAGLWLSAKLYELIYDLGIAAAAAQSVQLDQSLGKMKKEAAAVTLKYRKAKKSDIDSRLREVFSARLVSKGS